MEFKEKTQIKVGLFVFVGVFLAMLVIFFLEGESKVFRKQYTLYTNFTDISGLRGGAQVQLAGVPVGTVDRIYFSDNQSDKKIQLELKVNKEFQDRIRKNSVAQINTMGLLGDKFIALSLGDPAEPVLKDEEFVTSQENQGLANLSQKASQIMEKASAGVESLVNILNEIETGQGAVHALIYEKGLAQDLGNMTQALRQTSGDLRQVVSRINQGEGTVGALLSDPSIYNDIRRLFGKLERSRLLKHVIRSRIRDLELEKVENKTDTPSH